MACGCDGGFGVGAAVKGCAVLHRHGCGRYIWRLFLRFVAGHGGKHVVRLTLSDLTATEVIAFLKHLEEERGDTIGMRNCRLSA